MATPTTKPGLRLSSSIHPIQSPQRNYEIGGIVRYTYLRGHDIGRGIITCINNDDKVLTVKTETKTEEVDFGRVAGYESPERHNKKRCNGVKSDSVSDDAGEFDGEHNELDLLFRELEQCHAKSKSKPTTSNCGTAVTIDSSIVVWSLMEIFEIGNNVDFADIETKTIVHGTIVNTCAYTCIVAIESAGCLETREVAYRFILSNRK